MFDIAFSELVVIGIVALIVIGPDKLPKIARMAGHLLGRAQRYVNDVKSDINRELQLEEMQKLQDEIRQHTQQAGSIEYKAGQIIKHDMPQANDAALQQLAAAAASNAPEPSPYKQESLN